MVGRELVEHLRRHIQERNMTFKVAEKDFTFSFDVVGAYEDDASKIALFIDVDCSGRPLEYTTEDKERIDGYVRATVEREFPEVTGHLDRVGMLDILVMHPLEAPGNDDRMIEQIIRLCIIRGLEPEEAKRLMRRAINRISEMSDGPNKDGNGMPYYA